MDSLFEFDWLAIKSELDKYIDEVLVELCKYADIISVELYECANKVFIKLCEYIDAILLESYELSNSLWFVDICVLKIKLLLIGFFENKLSDSISYVSGPKF